MLQPGEGGEHGEQEQRIADIQGQLKAYGEQYGLRGLEGRIQRGLDPAGMLAVKETKEKLQHVANELGATEEAVIALTNELHVGAIWKHAAELAAATKPEVQTWMIAGEATTNGKEMEGDLDQSQFLQDLERVNQLLDQAVSNPQQLVELARENLITQSKEKFQLDGDVPVSDSDGGFLAMAVNGYTAGIVKDKDGLLFVGADALDYSALEQLGLHATEREDRGRMATFYVNAAGQDVVKKLYPGFAIVLSKDLETAKQLARTALRQSPEQAQ